MPHVEFPAVGLTIFASGLALALALGFNRCEKEAEEEPGRAGLRQSFEAVLPKRLRRRRRRRSKGEGGSEEFLIAEDSDGESEERSWSPGEGEEREDPYVLDDEAWAAHECIPSGSGKENQHFIGEMPERCTTDSFDAQFKAPRSCSTGEEEEPEEEEEDPYGLDDKAWAAHVCVVMPRVLQVKMIFNDQFGPEKHVEEALAALGAGAEEPFAEFEIDMKSTPIHRLM